MAAGVRLQETSRYRHLVDWVPALPALLYNRDDHTPTKILKMQWKKINHNVSCDYRWKELKCCQEHISEFELDFWTLTLTVRLSEKSNHIHASSDAVRTAHSDFDSSDQTSQESQNSEGPVCRTRLEMLDWRGAPLCSPNHRRHSAQTRGESAMESARSPQLWGLFIVQSPRFHDNEIYMFCAYALKAAHIFLSWV